MDGKHVSPQVGAEGSRSRNAIFLVCPLPHRGSELGYRDPRPPASQGETPPRPGLRKWRARRPPRPKGGRARGEREPPPRPGPAPQPPAARRPVRSPPSWRRPCRRSAPPAPPVAPAAAAALGPPCRSRLGLASRARTACLLARSLGPLARPLASRSPPRPPPRTRTGSPAGGRLQAAPPLAPSRWLAARAVARAAELPREDRGCRGRAGRTPPRLRTPERPAGSRGRGGGRRRGGPALTVFFKVTSSAINSRG